MASNDLKIEWEEPPNVRRFGVGGEEALDHHAFAAELRNNPGVWAKVPKEYKTVGSASSVAVYIINGTGKAYAPAGAFEAVSRGVLVYARYTGGGTSE